MEQRWKRIYSKDHKLMYTGYVVDGKPFGTGISYYENGNKCQEGVFDDNGLVQGKEYYQNGNLRFEGVFTHNTGRGPNYPTYGTCYDEDGNEIFYGELEIKKSTRGFPRVVKPEEYGVINPKGRPVFSEQTWAEEDSVLGGTYYVDAGGSERVELVELLERNGFKCEEDGITTRDSMLASRYPIKIVFDSKVYGHIHTTTGSAAAEAARAVFPVDIFMDIFECSFAFVIV